MTQQHQQRSSATQSRRGHSSHICAATRYCKSSVPSSSCSHSSSACSTYAASPHSYSYNRTTISAPSYSDSHKYTHACHHSHTHRDACIHAHVMCISSACVDQHIWRDVVIVILRLYNERRHTRIQHDAGVRHHVNTSKYTRIHTYIHIHPIHVWCDSRVCVDVVYTQVLQS